MLPSVPFDGVPRGRSLNVSAVGPASVPTGQAGIMSAAPGCSVIGPGPSLAPNATVTASGSGQMSSNVLKAVLLGAEEEARILINCCAS